MTDPKPDAQSATPSELRAQAEARLAAARADLADLSPQDAQALLYELHVHQVELQIQNEQLRTAQAELAEVRDRYVDLYERAPVGYLTLNASGAIQEANHAAATLLGEEMAKLLGKRLDALLVSADRDACFRHLRSAARTDSRSTVELRVQSAAQPARWIQLDSLWRSADGPDAGEFWVTLWDISDRRRAEAALRETNESLEQRVAERTSMLKLLTDVATAANEAKNLQRALRYTLKRVSEHNGWAFGHAYVVEEDGLDVLVPVRVYYAAAPGRFEPFRAVTLGARLRGGQGLPGRALATRKIQWADELETELVARRAEVGHALGLRCAIALPVFAGDEVVAVLEFFSDRDIEPADRLLESMASIGMQLGRVVERTRAEQSLARALLNEQGRVGRDLHDTVGQEMAAIALIAERMAADGGAGRPVDAAALEELSGNLRQCLQRFRGVIRGLLPPLDEGTEALPAQLDELAENLGRAYGVAVTVESVPVIAIDNLETAVHLYRIAAEAATNAARHARANRVEIRLALEGDLLVLEVQDDGTGDPEHFAAGGAGLHIMQHRANVIGADFELRRRPDGGTLVRCSVPLARVGRLGA